MKKIQKNNPFRNVSSQMSLNESLGNGDAFLTKEKAIYIETRFVVHGSKTQRKMANFGEVRVVEKCRAILHLHLHIPTQIPTHPML